jgi:hypothetical protein
MTSFISRSFRFCVSATHCKRNHRDEKCPAGIGWQTHQQEFVSRALPPSHIRPRVFPLPCHRGLLTSVGRSCKPCRIVPNADHTLNNHRLCRNACLCHKPTPGDLWGGCPAAKPQQIIAPQLLRSNTGHKNALKPLFFTPNPPCKKLRLTVLTCIRNDKSLWLKKDRRSQIVRSQIVCPLVTPSEITDCVSPCHAI